MNNNKLIGIMAEKKVTQRQLAKELGLSKNTVNAKLNGASRWDTDEAARICDILGIIDDAVRVEIFLS